MSSPRLSFSAAHLPRTTTPASTCESRHRPESATLRTSPLLSYDHCWVRASEHAASSVPAPSFTAPLMSRHRSAPALRSLDWPGAVGRWAVPGDDWEPTPGVVPPFAPLEAAGSTPSSCENSPAANTVASNPAEATPTPVSRAREFRGAPGDLRPGSGIRGMMRGRPPPCRADELRVRSGCCVRPGRVSR